MRALWLVFALAAAHTAAAQVVDEPTFDWTGTLPAGATLHLDDVDGNIRVSGTSSSEVRVHGQRTHFMSGSHALVFEVVKDGGDVMICARYHDGSCDARGSHGSGLHLSVGQSAQADLTVELPAGVKLAAKSGDGAIDVDNAGADVSVVSGDGAIRVSGVTGDLKAKSGDGNITVENAQHAVSAHTGDGSIAITATAGPIEATSGDGSIQLRDPNPGNAELHTGDGSVTVFLGGQFSGQLDASTSDGHIDSDMPLVFNGRMSAQHVVGTLGSGGDSHLTIHTGDGDIRIKKE